MPITSSNPITIPSGGDNLAISLILSATFQSPGVSASAQLITQHFRCNSDGTDPIPIGQAAVENEPDIFVAAESDSAKAALVETLYAALQTYATAKNL